MQNEDLNVDQWLSVSSGVFALLGVAIGNAMTMIAAAFANKRRKNEMLLAKLDEMTTAYEQVRNWVLDISQETSLAAVQAKPLTGCARFQALTILYFPDLEPKAAKVVESLQGFYVWAVRQLVQLGPGAKIDMPFQVWVRMNPAMEAEADRYYQNLTRCQEELVVAMKSKAQQLLGKS
jgi:hypothetical protein